MKETTKAFYVKSILKAQQYVQCNLDKQLSMDELSEYVGISKYHFHRIFCAMTGESIKQFSKRVRLEYTAVSLISTEKPIIDVAFESGYETHESFTRAFKNHFGVAPKDFRSMERMHAAIVITGKRPNISSSEEKMEVTLQKFEDMEVIYMRHTGPYEGAGKTWEDLCSAPGLMAQLSEKNLFFGLCYDDPQITEASKIRYDACISIDSSFKIPEGLETMTVPGGDYGVHRHVGSYAGLKDKYAWLYGTWLPSSGREPKKAPPLEIYRNSPTNTPEDQLITDICIPLS